MLALSPASGSASQALTGVGLLQPDGITTVDLATLQDRGIDPNVGPVVLGCGAQDTPIPREIALSERCHHTTWTGTGDVQTDDIPDREDVPDPSVLHKILLARSRLHHDVWPEPSHLEAPLGIQHAQPIKGGGTEKMREGTIEKSAL